MILLGAGRSIGHRRHPLDTAAAHQLTLELLRQIELLQSTSSLENEGEEIAKTLRGIALSEVNQLSGGDHDSAQWAPERDASVISFGSPAQWMSVCYGAVLLADSCATRGDLATAERLLSGFLEIPRHPASRRNDLERLDMALRALTDLHYRGGDLHAALAVALQRPLICAEYRVVHNEGGEDMTYDGDIEAWAHLGQIYHALGNSEDARRHILKAIDLDSEVHGSSTPTRRSLTELKELLADT